MNGHLSSESISKWLAGERQAADELHVAGCPECTGKLAHEQELLAAFGESVRGWSAASERAPAAIRTGAAASPLRVAGWAFAMAALAVCVILPIWKDSRDERREAEQAKADALLWEQVDAHISRPAPAAFAPLMELVAWEPAGSEAEEGEQP